jgi:hypothetical protein
LIYEQPEYIFPESSRNPTLMMAAGTAMHNFQVALTISLVALAKQVAAKSTRQSKWNNKKPALTKPLHPNKTHG